MAQTLTYEREQRFEADEFIFNEYKRRKSERGWPTGGGGPARQEGEMMGVRGQEGKALATREEGFIYD